MKFNKTLVAVAIAGIAAAPSIATAATTLSGIVQVQVKGSDADDIEAQAATDTTEAVEASSPGDLSVANGDVRLTIVSEHELNSGLTGYAGMRFDIDGLSNQKDVSGDSVHVGIKGGFGDFRMGETAVAVEYGQVANDIFDVADDMEEALTYTGSFGPVGLALNWSPEQNDDRVGAGVKFGLGGFAIGLGFENEGDTDKVAAGAAFSYAGAAIAAHFWTKDTDDASEESFSVKVGYGFGGVDAALTLSTLTSNDGGQGSPDVDAEAIRLDLGYDLGGDMNVSTRITSKTGDVEADEVTEYRVQLAKTF